MPFSMGRLSSRRVPLRQHGAILVSGRTARAGPVVALTALALGGCALLPASVPVVEPEQVRLSDDVVAVVGFSPQLHDQKPIGNSSHAFVVVIHGDGRSDTIRTTFMHGVSPVWVGDVATVRDQEHQYRLTPDGTTLEDRDGINTIQFAAGSGPDDTTAVSLYDVGACAPGGGNLQEVDSLDAEGRISSVRFTGSTMGLFPCAGSVYGIDYIPTTRESALPSKTEDGTPTKFLFRILPRPGRGESDVVSQVSPEQDSVILDKDGAGCRDDNLYFLGSDGPGWKAVSERASVGMEEVSPEARTPVLRSWNTRSGQVQDLPLRSASELPLPTDRITLDAHSLFGDELFWYAATGIVYATNITTGLTRDAFHTAPEPVNVRSDGHIDDESVVQFASGRMFRVSAPKEGSEEPGSVTGWDLATGRKTLDVSVPAIHEIVAEPGHFQRPWGVAMNPEVLRSGALPGSDGSEAHPEPFP